MSPAAVYRRFAIELLVALCRDHFADPVHGGFYEQLDPTGKPLPLGTKRLLVQCRQLYVLSHAALLGNASGEAAALAGYDFLRRSYLDRAQGGWFFRVSDDGEPTDRSKDLYGHAFVLFALAYLYRAFAVPDAIVLAEATYDVVRARLAAPGGGFWDRGSESWEPERSVRRQNPHMHLLEALLALFEATGERRWLAEADALVALFRARFFDPSTATLGEYFTADWSPDPQRGQIIEPGHHYEWVWLLYRHAALAGCPVEAAAEALFGHAERHGFDAEHGGIQDQVDRSGAPLLRTRRIWPVTEAIKAQAARVEAGRPVAAGQLDRLVEHLLTAFIRPARLGWIETMRADGTPTGTNLPGSTPYHLFLAAAELARVAG